MKNYNIILLVLFSSLIAKAKDYSFTYQEEAIKIKSGDIQFINFKSGHYLDRISFEAKNSCGGSSSILKVSADGGVRYSSVSVNGKDWKTYIASFSEFSRSLEVYNSSSKGCVKLKDVKILPRRLHSGGGYFGAEYVVTANDAYYYVGDLKVKLDYLVHTIEFEDTKNYIAPLNIVLGDALSILETTSELSPASAQAVSNVVAELNKMEPLLNQLMSTPSAQDIAREIKSTRRVLERMLLDY
ncbi:MAG: hypothetical protein H6620_07450 [Halobacteriovoraceae bacterium]|nr:hypothetical protein [Halobacteriovoraceae bacterium]